MEMNDDLEPQSDQSSDYLPLQSQSQSQSPQPRRPRGFAAAAAASSPGPAKGRREREKEKERTKLRERLRRSITSRMLAGLRQYGNFPLPARADMNDVLAALARDAGWVVEADGTTYRQPPPPPIGGAEFSMTSLDTPLVTTSGAAKLPSDYHHSIIIPRIQESLSPDSVVIGAKSPPPILETHDDHHHFPSVTHFTPVPYVPLCVLLSTSFIDNYGQLLDPQGLTQELTLLQSLEADGVIVRCWWGIVEGYSPHKYNWSGYRALFDIIREFKLKLQVVIAFHEHGREAGDGLIPLPQWVSEIGKENQDIFFTDREGRRNTECLSWGVDKERVLHGRSGLEVYFDFMRSFRTEFDDLFAEGLISAVEIGLGASGELKYPSFSETMGWTYPGIGEFQCYDKYLQQSLEKAAKLRGHSFWARGPDNAGVYNSRPHETGFFCERGDYDSYYGRFFLNWYAKTLIDHADNVLSLASLAFDQTEIIVKIPAVYWWYKTPSHAAELTSGYYNPTNQDGYSPVFEVLKKYSVTVKFVCLGPHDNDEALADPEGLSWQMLNLAWDQGLSVAGENALSHYDREGCMRIVDMVKPRHNPDRHHFTFFVYQQPLPIGQGTICFPELDLFIKCMHGDIAGNLVSC